MSCSSRSSATLPRSNVRSRLRLRVPRRPSSPSGVSGGTHQATTGSKEPSSTVTLEKTQGLAKHVALSGTNVSPETPPDCKTRKRRLDKFKECNAPSKRLRKSDSLPDTGRPSTSSASFYTTPQRVGILCLPLELKQQVLSYVSARETVRFRRVCKSTNQLVFSSTKHFVKLYAGRELLRLRGVVNEFNDLKTTTDADSLVEALHVWTKRRGDLLILPHQRARLSR